MKRNGKVKVVAAIGAALFLLAVCVLYYSAGNIGPPSGFLPYRILNHSPWLLAPYLSAASSTARYSGVILFPSFQFSNSVAAASASCSQSAFSRVLFDGRCPSFNVTLRRLGIDRNPDAPPCCRKVTHDDQRREFFIGAAAAR
jgi:hypothetical protein